tara:strand:- start:14210 stop:15097 length:888 start_codon:yes stop_codon:yes gene_type:complete
MDKFSKKLLEQAPKFEKGKIYVFQLEGLRKVKGGIVIPAGVIIPSSYSIYDTGDGTNKTINIVDKIVPGTKGKDPTIKLKDVVFDKNLKGKIVCDGSKQRERDLFHYLYFSPFNKANKGKEFHIPSKAGYLYKYIDNDKIEIMSVDKKKKALAAQNLAMTIDEDQLRIICEQLGKDKNSKPKFLYKDSMSEEGLRMSLVAFAEKNPVKVLRLDDEVDLALRGLIKDAIKGEVIYHDKALEQASWCDTREPIVVVPSGSSMDSILVGYLLTTDGDKVRETMMKSLKARGVEEYMEV